MAGDWLKVRLDLRNDPAVIGMAEELGMDQDTVVGKLVRLWSWFNSQSRDGHARVTLKFVDRHVEKNGFAESMQNNGWLDVQSIDGVQAVIIPDWDRHNGKSAKNRCLAQSRSKNYRDKASRSRHAAVTESSRLEKRREEYTPIVPKGTKKREAEKQKRPPISTKDVEKIYRAYPRRVGKVAAHRAIRKALKTSGMTVEAMLAHVQAYAASETRMGGAEERYIKYPGPWFSGGHYHDEFSTTPNEDFDGRFANAS